MTKKQHIQNIQEFANKHKVVLELEGECGFGRECVGLLHGNNYVDFNPTDDTTYEYIKGFFDPRLDEIMPPKAYHKHDCLAVLGRDEESIRQLSEWVDKLKELDVTIESYDTGATGVQALISGITHMAVKVNKPNTTE